MPLRTLRVVRDAPLTEEETLLKEAVLQLDARAMALAKSLCHVPEGHSKTDIRLTLPSWQLWCRRYYRDLCRLVLEETGLVLEVHGALVDLPLLMPDETPEPGHPVIIDQVTVMPVIFVKRLHT